MANYRAGMLQVLGMGIAGAGAGYSSFVDEQSKFDKQMKLDGARAKRDTDLEQFKMKGRETATIAAEKRAALTRTTERKEELEFAGKKVDIEFEKKEEQRMSLIAKLPPEQQAAASLASIGKMIGFDPAKVGLDQEAWTQRYVTMYEQNLRAIKDSAAGAEMTPGELTEAASMETQKSMVDMLKQMRPAEKPTPGAGSRVNQIVDMLNQTDDPLTSLEESKATLRPGEYEEIKALLTSTRAVPAEAEGPPRPSFMEDPRNIERMGGMLKERLGPSPAPKVLDEESGFMKAFRSR